MAKKSTAGKELDSPRKAGTEETHLDVPCCPDLKTEEVCDSLDFHYRTVHTTSVRVNNQVRRVPVEVTIHARLERCAGPLALGDLAYSSTLLPGEKVRLFTADRRTRFSFDSSSSLSYRKEQTSEEQYFMSSMSSFMSDLTVRDEANSSNTHRGSFETHAETNGAIQAFLSGPSVDVNGSFDSQSTSTFLRELTQHAEASHNSSVQATRTANSVSIGEVQTRSHSEGESEDHFESSSRTFRNPNKCRAITFFFYQINKTQTTRFVIESIRRRVIDPAADTKAANNPFTSQGEISVIPAGVLATDKQRLDLEKSGRLSVAAQVGEAVRIRPGGSSSGATLGSRAAFLNAGAAEPLPRTARLQALRLVDNDLIREGLLDKSTGEISKETKARFTFEKTTSLPTPGLLVRGCIDECSVCEPELQQEIELDLEHKKLKNRLLERQIELLDKAQEYRCCPEDETEDTDPPADS